MTIMQSDAAAKAPPGAIETLALRTAGSSLPPYSMLVRGRRKLAGLGRCAEAGPVVLMRSRLMEGRSRLKFDVDMAPEYTLSCRACG